MQEPVIYLVDDDAAVRAAATMAVRRGRCRLVGAPVVLMFWIVDFAVIIFYVFSFKPSNEPTGFRRVTPLTELWRLAGSRIHPAVSGGPGRAAHECRQEKPRR